VTTPTASTCVTPAPRIERLLGLLVHHYGARKTRYIGAAKARLQALWALVNLNPIARHLGAEAT